MSSLLFSTLKAISNTFGTPSIQAGPLAFSLAIAKGQPGQSTLTSTEASLAELCPSMASVATSRGIKKAVAVNASALLAKSERSNIFDDDNTVLPSFLNIRDEVAGDVLMNDEVVRYTQLRGVGG